MDRPVVQSVENAATGEVRLRRARPARSDGSATRLRILEATRRCLREKGYAQLNVRDIAKDAGVNHALIGYHFRGKQQLVLAVLDDANQRLLERQTRMYAAPSGAAEKWRQAREFYEEDLQSGFVRLLMELMGASFHDEALRREFVPRLLAWKQVVEDAVVQFVDASKLELPVSPRAIAAAITWFWIGMEASMTLGVTEEQGHHREALDLVTALLQQAEGRPARRRPASRART